MTFVVDLVNAIGTTTKSDSFYNSIFYNSILYATLYNELKTISMKGGVYDQYVILNLILDALVKILPVPPPTLPPLSEVASSQQDKLIAALQYLADTLRCETSSPIINKIKQIKTKIQTNTDLTIQDKGELEDELTSLENQITNYFFVNYGVLVFPTGELLLEIQSRIQNFLDRLKL
jgi:hypothetical protein